MSVDLVLAGNGPGELTGWVRPVARSARDIGPADLRLTLVLSPTQFAGGREVDVVKSWGLFDRILTPAEGIRLALGRLRFEAGPRGSVLHLGGDLWFSAQIARRLKIPACAFAETLLVARKHGAFAEIFATSEDLARQLSTRGVPEEKIVVTGDPRVDAMLRATREPPAPLNRPPRPIPVVSLLPGSRDRYVRALLPYLLRVADALRSSRPRVTFQIIAAEFLSPGLLASMRALASDRWPALNAVWVTSDPWTALARSDLALTFPGTSTVELAMLGVPFAAIVPLEFVDRVPAEGVVEWIGRIPGVGRMVKRVAAWRYFARPRLMALPNIRAGRAIAPEWIGRWTPAELANRVSDLLDDETRRKAMRTELRSLYSSSGGAATRIAEHALELAATLRESRP
ncbi:MAG: hypothetical protein AUG75_10715 [Cyanobacteria bacterium 13_1_20CM_4_61_6]|nr:MAG: hypothetical protein AUG75_10715 [Cyanobacteria bacterium 13_1_20CM_4_61_6]